MAKTGTITINIHQGLNIKCFREMLDIEQDTLAYDFGDPWNHLYCCYTTHGLVYQA